MKYEVSKTVPMETAPLPSCPHPQLPFSPLIAPSLSLPLALLPSLSFLNYRAGGGSIQNLFHRTGMWVCICPYDKFTEEERGGGWRHSTASSANSEVKRKQKLHVHGREKKVCLSFTVNDDVTRAIHVSTNQDKDCLTE